MGIDTKIKEQCAAIKIQVDPGRDQQCVARNFIANDALKRSTCQRYRLTQLHTAALISLSIQRICCNSAPLETSTISGSVDDRPETALQVRTVNSDTAVIMNIVLAIEVEFVVPPSGGVLQVSPAYSA